MQLCVQACVCLTVFGMRECVLFFFFVYVFRSVTCFSYEQNIVDMVLRCSRHLNYGLFTKKKKKNEVDSHTLLVTIYTNKSVKFILVYFFSIHFFSNVYELILCHIQIHTQFQKKENSFIFLVSVGMRALCVCI